MKPSLYPEVRGYPHLRELLRVQVDMQFGDIHTILQLPNPAVGLEAGCNLALANVLFSMISGASTLFFEADLAYLKGRKRDSGSRFKGVLEHHYPWRDDLEDFTRVERRDLIYYFARNPIVHSFGVGKTPHLMPGVPKAGAIPVKIAKGPLNAAAADEVMAGERPPSPALPPTLRRDNDGSAVVSVIGLAWGTAAMLRSIFSDDEQGARADELARQLLTEPV